jgi:hypothetical protein
MRFLVCPSGTSFWGIRNPVLNSGQNCHDHRFDVKLKRFASKLNAPNAHQAHRFQGGSDGPVSTTFRHPTRPSLRCLRRRAGTGPEAAAWPLTEWRPWPGIAPGRKLPVTTEDEHWAPALCPLSLVLQTGGGGFRKFRVLLKWRCKPSLARSLVLGVTMPAETTKQRASALLFLPRMLLLRLLRHEHLL